jgi:SAM-dependent methyltransferase
MNISKETSPVTGEPGTAFITDISIDKVIELYDEMNIDIRRFFKGLDKIEIRKCTQTGYRYYFPFNIFGDGQFYEDLQKSTKHYYPTDKWEHLQAIKHINAGDNVLEVGCATGYFLNMIRKKGANCAGLEMNKNAIAEARQQGLTIFEEFLHEHSVSHEGKYDVVCSFQVLEHIWDVRDYFESAKRCLKPGGKIIIAVPFNNPYFYRHDIYRTLNLPPHHAGMWDKAAFLHAGNFFGLTTIYLKTEPLLEYKAWYKVQANYIKEKHPLLGKLMFLVPRQLYKPVLWAASPWIAGQGVLAIFRM